MGSIAKGCLCLAAVTAGFMHGARAQQVAPPSGSPGLEEIVVTAQKRSENLQQVPISITALDAATLADERVESINDLMGLAPNMQVAQGAPAAGPTNPNIAIRGIESNVNDVGAEDSPIAIYLDGVYLARAVGAVFDVADIERIEVLEGPQGTLYGRNAVGGAINVITQEPKGVFGVKQDLSGGNYGEFRTRTRLDLPEAAGLSASITFLHSENGGYVHNVGAGQTWNFATATNGHLGIETSPSMLGSSDTNAVFVALKYQPPALDNLTINYKFDYSDENDVPNGQQLVAVYAPATAIYGLQPPGFRPIVSYSPSYTVNNPFATENPSTIWGQSLTIDYTVNDWLKLKSLTGYRSLQVTDTNQLDGGNNLMLGGQPYGLIVATEFADQHELSEELDANLTTSFVDATAGIYYFHEGSANYVNEIVFESIPNHTPGLPGVSQSNDNMNVSVYGQATFHLIDKLDLTAGLRYSTDDRATTDLTSDGFTGESVHHRVDWLAELAYHFTPDIMAYGKVSTGYISGGDYNSVAFQPETITTAEAGAKSDMLEKRLRANVAIYWSDLRNYQQFTLTPSVCGLAGQCIFNFGATHIFGGEAQLSALPTDHIVCWTAASAIRTRCRNRARRRYRRCRRSSRRWSASDSAPSMISTSSGAASHRSGSRRNIPRQCIGGRLPASPRILRRPDIGW
jgi:iron complex outermembrane recepter protein